MVFSMTTSSMDISVDLNNDEIVIKAHDPITLKNYIDKLTVATLKQIITCELLTTPKLIYEIVVNAFQNIHGASSVLKWEDDTLIIRIDVVGPYIKSTFTIHLRLCKGCIKDQVNFIMLDRKNTLNRLDITEKNMLEMYSFFRTKRWIITNRPQWELLDTYYARYNTAMVEINQTVLDFIQFRECICESYGHSITTKMNKGILYVTNNLY